jgi:hypothetical protein
LFHPLPLAESDTRTAAVLVDKFDAGGNKYFFDLLQRGRITGVSANFNIIDCIPM